ncbi:MAG: hypothetical protein VX704_01120, partial [Verrucomicrobiota bacterium]|nr:hypothetical protein [Verrucomicrobiota bacterium]
DLTGGTDTTIPHTATTPPLTKQRRQQQQQHHSPHQHQMPPQPSSHDNNNNQCLPNSFHIPDAAVLENSRGNGSGNSNNDHEISGPPTAGGCKAPNRVCGVEEEVGNNAGILSHRQHDQEKDLDDQDHLEFCRERSTIPVKWLFGGNDIGRAWNNKNTAVALVAGKKKNTKDDPTTNINFRSFLSSSFEFLNALPAPPPRRSPQMRYGHHHHSSRNVTTPPKEEDNKQDSSLSAALSLWMPLWNPSSAAAAITTAAAATTVKKEQQHGWVSSYPSAPSTQSAPWWWLLWSEQLLARQQQTNKKDTGNKKNQLAIISSVSFPTFPRQQEILY